MLFSKKEPPLHQAVIDNNLQQVMLLSSEKQARILKNYLGFTPLELARYLNHKKCQKILDPYANWKIQVLPKDCEFPVLWNEKDFKEYFNVGYRPYLNFETYPFFKEALANCPLTIKGFLGEENQQKAALFKHELYNGYRAKTTIQWVNDDLGFGLYTDFPLVTGEYVGEFTGKVRRIRQWKPELNEYCFHYPSKWFSLKYMVIDALEEGNETRFINHSDNPNLQPLCLCERDLLHVVFVAKRPIEAGEQLTYNYGKDFWKYRQKAKG